jgi:aryl-alcohol dehydrogenase-like predicted oxidoreductase
MRNEFKIDFYQMRYSIIGRYVEEREMITYKIMKSLQVAMLPYSVQRWKRQIAIGKGTSYL